MEEITSKTGAVVSPSIILTAGNWGSQMRRSVNPSANKFIVAPYGAGPLHTGTRTERLHRHAAFSGSSLLTEAFVLKDQFTLHSKLTELISSEHIIVG